MYFCVCTSLQAFSSRLFFNSETGFFEQVHGEGVQEWQGVTPSTSLATLYLTDDAVGPVSSIIEIIMLCF